RPLGAGPRRARIGAEPRAARQGPAHERPRHGGCGDEPTVLGRRASDQPCAGRAAGREGGDARRAGRARLPRLRGCARDPAADDTERPLCSAGPAHAPVATLDLHRGPGPGRPGRARHAPRPLHDPLRARPLGHGGRTAPGLRLRRGRLTPMRLGRVPGVRQVPPLLRRIDDRTALFESWHGGYSDNPRAISEALARRGGQLERLWATEDAGAPPNSRRYLEALGRARYLVTNLNMPDYFRKKHGTTYLQTWHGTPLKRIAYDIEGPSFPDRKGFLERLSRD